MKKILSLLTLLLVFQLSAQKTVSKEQWQQDLRFLQKTVNEDFSFLYKKVTAKEFNDAVDQFHDEIPNLEEHEIIVGISRMIALFKYGHTNISFHQKPYQFSQLPYNLYEFNDGVYIEGTHKNYPKAVGAKVITIAGKPVSEALEMIRPTVEEENPQYFKAYGINNARYPEVLHAQGVTSKLQSSIRLTLEKDGQQFEQVFNILPNKERVPTYYGFVSKKEDWISARNQNATPLYLKNLDKIYFYEYLPEQKTVYVRHSQIQNDSSETIEAFYKRVFEFVEKNDVEKFVLDVRLNGGGNNFLNKPIITGIIRTEKINQTGKLFVITGRRTFSACQNLVNRLDNYTNAIFVGEPTAENINFYGDNRPVMLPNSRLTVRLSFAWWQDKEPWGNEDALSPQLSADMSFQEYTNNEDPVLEATFNFNPEGFIVRPMDHIRNLFVQGKMEELQKDIARMVQDPRYRFFDFEGKFINSGKLLLNQSQYRYAIGVFTMVTQVYPNSEKAWRYLGDGYAAIGEETKAKEFYKKAASILSSK